MAEKHPLADVSMKIKNFKSFGDHPSGFENFEPINLIIGRNNVGKSTLLDAIDLCISNGGTYDAGLHNHDGSSYSVFIGQDLDNDSLLSVFSRHSSRGGVPGPNHWEYGKQFIGTRYVRSYSEPWQAEVIEGPEFNEIPTANRRDYLINLLSVTTWPFQNLHLLRVSAERDVTPEPVGSERKLLPNGTGVTNVIRGFLTSDNLPRGEVEEGLLNDLNIIYKGDCEFTRILCQENENTKNWELFLVESEKGDIRLSQSGSSLKSIFIILSMLRLFPFIQQNDWEETIFSIEEPENNLHPALLKRLLDFLANERKEKGFTLIVTTHSPIGIDWSAQREDSQIVHVLHDGSAAQTRTAKEYSHNKDILEDLEIRASDILQANGIVWVEGPSDRIYLKRWLEIASDGFLKEGIHYTVMFYGGRLLSHLDALVPDESEKLISLLSINRNIALLMDSDRHQGTNQSKGKPRMRINNTKRRLLEEIKKVDGYAWISEGREVENYVAVNVYERLTGKKAPKSINKYTQIADHALVSDYKDKITLAHSAAEETNKGDMTDHLDLWKRIDELSQHIRRWNGLN